MALLSNTVDESNASALPNGAQIDLMGEEGNEESFIEHEGKRYQRIQIEGLE